MFLRRPVKGDHEEFTSMARRSQRFHRGVMALAKTREKFEGFLKKIDGPETECFLICRRTDGAIVGILSLSQIFYGPLQSAYLGYGLGAGETGKGYAREAVKLVLRFAFLELKLHRVEANIQPENLPSIRLVQKLGFSKEGYSPRYLKIGGRWRDHERWAIIKENWKPGR